jgi:DNA-binding beta-propeller fold protein YncE
MISGQGRTLLAQAGGALAIAVLIAGCGDNYRPTVTPIYSTGPAAQPTSYVVVVSTTGVSADGVVTLIDYSGDSILTEATIGPGPTAFTLDELGATGYTLDSDGTLSNFAITTSLQTKNVSFSTVSPCSHLVNLMPPSSGLWAIDLNTQTSQSTSSNCQNTLSNDVVDIFQGSPQAFKLAIPVAVPVAPASTTAATMPVFIAGSPSLSGQREYVLSQNVPDSPLALQTEAVTCNNPANFASVSTGVAIPIEISSNTTDPAIPVGKCPVFAVPSSDQQRLFILNRGDDTITVINARNNTLDTCTPFQNQNGQTVNCHPTLPLSLSAVSAINAQCAISKSTLPPCGGPPNGTAGMTATAGPVYAEYNQATQQLVVSNYDGGTISVIDVSLDEYGNDSSTSGTTYTVSVGNTATPNPASVTVLYDGTKAYTANQNDGVQNGTVTVVNLSTHTVEKTITVVGHPRTVVNTQNSEYAKIYTGSPDSPYITIIESSPTVTDLVDTTVLVDGTVVDVRTTSQNGTSGNNDYSSRVPGYGQPCNLSPAAMVATYGANYTLAECQAIP